MLGAILCGCAADSAQNPRRVIDDYAAALERGDVAHAYSLLSVEAKKGLTLSAFERMVKENPRDAREVAEALTRPVAKAYVTATVTASDGRELRLVLEDGEWKLQASAVDLYSQATPRGAVTAFVRAFNNRRYDILMRFVPKSKREGLDTAKLKAAWEGEQKSEMRRLIDAISASLPEAKVEELGERATLGYGGGGTVELIREDGVWRIEEF